MNKITLSFSLNEAKILYEQASLERRLELEEQFPKKVCFTVWGENMISALDSIKEDDQIKVYFSVESREYNERWYTDLKAYRIDSLMSVNLPQVEVPEHEDMIPFGAPEDLPF